MVFFRTVDELRAAPEGSLKGKIAYISHQMRPAQDGSHYGFAGPARWVGAGIAASKGAVATVIKSVGTDHHRNPHTGGTSFPGGVAAIPAGALSLPDADRRRRPATGHADLRQVRQRAHGHLAGARTHTRDHRPVDLCRGVEIAEVGDDGACPGDRKTRRLAGFGF